MASRYFTEFAERKVSKGGARPSPGSKGTPGREAAGGALTERTANWPTPGPMRGAGFNRTTKMPTVKVAAKSAGCGG